MDGERARRSALKETDRRIGKKRGAPSNALAIPNSSTMASRGMLPVTRLAPSVSSELLHTSTLPLSSALSLSPSLPGPSNSRSSQRRAATRAKNREKTPYSTRSSGPIKKRTMTQKIQAPQDTHRVAQQSPSAMKTISTGTFSRMWFPGPATDGQGPASQMSASEAGPLLPNDVGQHEQRPMPSASAPQGSTLPHPGSSIVVASRRDASPLVAQANIHEELQKRLSNGGWQAILAERRAKRKPLPHEENSRTPSLLLSSALSLSPSTPGPSNCRSSERRATTRAKNREMTPYGTPYSRSIKKSTMSQETRVPQDTHCVAQQRPSAMMSISSGTGTWAAGPAMDGQGPASQTSTSEAGTLLPNDVGQNGQRPMPSASSPQGSTLPHPLAAQANIHDELRTRLSSNGGFQAILAECRAKRKPLLHVQNVP